MPNWTSQIPDPGTKYGFDLRRTPPDHPLVAIVITPDMIGCHTHYWGGRTIPCEDIQCPACAENMPSRWHAYLGCWDPKTRDTFLFECTAKAAQAFELYRESFGTLRGCLFSAARPKRRKNARVEILTKPADLTHVNLPPAIDVTRAMTVIWQLPANACTTPTAEHSTPTVHTDPAILNRTRSDLEPSNGKKTK
jgi:hypothetical protein